MRILLPVYLGDAMLIIGRMPGEKCEPFCIEPNAL